MKILASLIVGLVCVMPSHAQSVDCTPTLVESLLWGQPGQALLPALTEPAYFVPAGEVWKIRAAGIGTDDGSSIEWMLQIDHRVVSQGNACCWLIPLMRLTGTSAGTPVLALNREVILTAGERLSARVNGLHADKSMLLAYVGWKFPAACTAALVVPMSGGGSQTTPVPAPDFSALMAAATTLQQAATALSAAIPR